MDNTHTHPASPPEADAGGLLAKYRTKLDDAEWRATIAEQVVEQLVKQVAELEKTITDELAATLEEPPEAGDGA